MKVQKLVDYAMGDPFIMKLESASVLSREELGPLEALTGAKQIVERAVVLAEEGSAPSAAHIFHHGWGIRYRYLPSGARQIINFVLPGDICDVNIFAMRCYDSSLATISPCIVSKLDADALARLIGGHLCLERALWWEAAHEQSMLRGHIVAIGRQSARERVAYLLLEFWYRLRSVGMADGGSYRLPVSQSLLADALGLSVVHVNRTLQELRANRLISYQSGTVRIIEAEKLGRIGAFDARYLQLS